MNITDGTLPFTALKISDPGFENPRTHSGLGDDEIRETALSILKHGLLVPLLVRTGLVLAGKRRWHALGLLHYWAAGGNVDLPEAAPGDWDRAKRLLGAVPVRYLSLDEGETLEWSALALVDNLFRSDLSSYEIAAALAKMSDDGKTGVAIAQMIGKSPSYVSRKLTCWKKSGPELRDAWRDGMAEDVVEEFAKFSFDAQAKALAGKVPRGRRGPAHRPSVDAVRDFLYELEHRDDRGLFMLGDAGDAYYAGVVDALRWATGAKVGPEFVKLAESETSGV